MKADWHLPKHDLSPLLSSSFLSSFFLEEDPLLGLVPVPEP